MAGVLYFGNVEEKPILGKFNIEKTFKFSTHDKMWSDFEEVKEVDGINEAEQQLSEIAKRKRRNKLLRRKGNKRKLYIDSVRSSANQAPQATAVGAVEGTLVDTKVEDASYQYVLLQVLKPNDPKASGIHPESHMQAGVGAIVKVIPVGDWYNFQRPSKVSSDVSLDQINLDVDHQEKLMRQRSSKLK